MKVKNTTNSMSSIHNL